MSNMAAAARKLGRLWRVWVGIPALAAVLIYAGGACQRRTPPGKVAYEPGLPLPPDALLFTVTTTNRTSRIDVVGTVQSEERIHLSSRIQAYVQRVNVSAGSPVKAGQTLLTLDDRDIQEQLAAAEAQLKQAQSEYDRARQLLESKAATEQAYQAAENAFSTAKAQVERARVQLGYAAMVSPIDGVVTDRRIEAGDLASPGQVLLAVYDPRRMRLEAPVPMRLIRKLSLGQAVDVALEGSPDRVAGKVTEIVAEANPATRTQLVRVQLDVTDVIPGTFGRLFVNEDEGDVIVVPQSAVYAVGQLELVQVVRNTRVVRQLVKTGAARDGRVEILSGLKDQDVILVHPLKED